MPAAANKSDAPPQLRAPMNSAKRSDAQTEYRLQVEKYRKRVDTTTKNPSRGTKSVKNPFYYLMMSQL